MKKNDRYSVIGLMSGTSLDGLDIALCHFTVEKGQWDFIIEKAETVKYPSELENSLKNSIDSSAEQLANLDIKLGQWYSNVINDFRMGYDVDFIASHGHTIFHQPEKRLTCQIGNGTIIYATTQIPVIYDFRSLDVALGGQGAPLVPIGDELLFNDYEGCLNLGGIANISFNENDRRVAFDISPCNMVLNFLMNTVDKSYDNKGEQAKTGIVIPEILDRWNALDYYSINYPKSLGFEWVHQNMLKGIDLERHDLSDILCTAVEHISIQIANVINTIGSSDAKILVTGGGAKNTYLLERISAHLHPGKKLVVPEIEIVDYKEALIFAFLGVLRSRNHVNCLSSVTGASRDSSGGLMVGF